MAAKVSTIRFAPKLANAEHIWRSFDTFLFDADGVLWREIFPLEGAIQLVDKLVSAGKRVMIVTNNSTRDTEMHAEKCAKMGFKDGGGVLWREQFPIEGAIPLVNSLISTDKRVWIITNNSRKDAEQNAQKCTKLGFKGLTTSNIVASGVVLVNYIKKLKAMPQYSTTAHLPIYLLGTKGLQQFLTKNGIQSFGPGPDPIPTDQDFHFDNLHQFISKQPVFAVVTAFDEHISYPKIVKASNYLANPHVPFLATNTDSQFPGPEPGSLIPGAGSVSSPISYVSGRQPIVMGKPSRTCWEYICEQCEANGEKIEPSRTIMIGDRLDTDILFGHNSGLPTLLVLTGVTPTLEEAERLANGDAGLVPDFYAPNLSHLLLPNEKN